MLLLSMSAAAVGLGFIAPQGDASVRQHLSLGRAAMLKRRGMPWEYLLYVTLTVDSYVCSLKRLRGAFWGCLHVGLPVRQSPQHQAASATLSHSANPIYSPGDGEVQLSWDCYNPCDHEGEPKGKALRRGRGGGGSTVKRSIQKYSIFSYITTTEQWQLYCVNQSLIKGLIFLLRSQKVVFLWDQPADLRPDTNDCLVSNNPPWSRVQTLTARLKGQGELFLKGIDVGINVDPEHAA